MTDKINNKFNKKDVLHAYKKIKHYFYFDNTSLFIRKRIAEFEDNIKAVNGQTFEDAFMIRMEKMANEINDLSLDEWKLRMSEPGNIEYKITPKTFKKRQPVFITNYNDTKAPKLNRVNILIDASIEIHIITVLWIIEVGKYLSKEISDDNYAYQLQTIEDEREDEVKVVDGLRLYKPYFKQYQKWRDQALEQAEQLLDKKKNAVVLSLDIKDFFHSVKVNLKDIKNDIFDKNELYDNERADKLFDLVHLINKIYTEKIITVRNIPELLDSETLLPIGLLSSGLLGNYYLKELDKLIQDELNPHYYGRYVDDLLFVFKDSSVNHNAIYPINDFLSKYFVNRNILEYENLSELNPKFIGKITSNKSNSEVLYYKGPNEEDIIDDESFSSLLLGAKKLRFKIKNRPELIIQSEKVLLQYFDYKESPAIINKFKKKLDENRSEYRFLPEEEEVDSEFDEEAFLLHYNDSINKLRSIKEFNEDKYGASKYLANKIFASIFSDGKSDKKTNRQILTFFKGETALSFHTLWEKVATYFIINELPYELLSFYKQIKRSIKSIDYQHVDGTDTTIKKRISELLPRNLIEYLNISVATPLALNPEFHSSKLKAEIVDFEDIQTSSMEIRRSNIFRQHLIVVPALNYTDYSFNSDNTLIRVEEKGISDAHYQMNARLVFLAPRYVHFHEINLLHIYRTVGSIKKNEDAVKIDSILQDAFTEYWMLNNAWKYMASSKEELISKAAKKMKDYFSFNEQEVEQEMEVVNSGNTEKTFYIKTHEIEEFSDINKKIAIANIKVDKENSKKSILGSPNISRERRKQLFRLINQVESENCDILALPELSVPYQWINLLAYQSFRRDIGIVAGLEHWVNKENFAFNFIVTCLPINRKGYHTSLIKIRLKNHYSHEEKHLLKGYRLLIPGETVDKKFKKYDLFHWRKNYFSVYNCFELADIEDRALFKSKVDFIVASEYNKDTNYFADIGGAWVRDIHCYFIQVNSSDYGDSMILQPSKSVSSSILHIKGGINPAIIVDCIKIKELRDFQLMEYSLQKDAINKGITDFKPTPPDFNKEHVKKRIKNK